MYREYTQMAGGHNPREAATERFRNRFLHKLQFFRKDMEDHFAPDADAAVVTCPAGVNIIKIIDTVKEAETGA